MALAKKAIRAIAIRRSIERRAATTIPTNPNVAANDNGKKPMSKRLLAACVEAGGFDQNASYAS